MFTDSHCHLDYFKTDAEIKTVIQRAHENHVNRMLCVSVVPSAHHHIIAIIERYENIYASIGLHPCHVETEAEIDCAELLEIANNHPKIIAFGETGLDYFRKPFDITKQKRNFITHIQAAQETGLPLIVHNRNADTDLIQMLETHHAQKPFACILHCFSATSDLMQRAVTMGFYISFAGIITFKNSESLRNIAADVPKNLLLIETDSPYLAPEPMRGKRNEPAFIRHTATILAQVRGESIEALAKQTTDNFLTLMTKINSKLENVT